MRWSVLLLLTVGLAGCSEDPTAVQDDAFADLQAEFDGETGLIRGVVFDDAIVPVAGVTVTIEGPGTNATTDEQGRFQFTGLDAGTYFLTFSKAGYGDVQQSADVVAGPTEPAIVKVQLTRLPGTAPFIVPMQWDGFMACSWFIALAFYTGCGIGEQIDDDSRRFDAVDAVPEFLQSELLWEHTQPAGSNLCMRQYGSSGIGGDILASDACGPSPQIMALDADTLQQAGVGNTRGLERVVWVASWTEEAPTAGLAVDQTFTVYTHQFHNFLPQEGWLFIDDGPHPLP